MKDISANAGIMRDMNVTRDMNATDAIKI